MDKPDQYIDAKTPPTISPDHQLSTPKRLILSHLSTVESASVPQIARALTCSLRDALYFILCLNADAYIHQTEPGHYALTVHVDSEKDTTQ